MILQGYMASKCKKWDIKSILETITSVFNQISNQIIGKKKKRIARQLKKTFTLKIGKKNRFGIKKTAFPEGKIINLDVHVPFYL